MGHDTMQITILIIRVSDKHIKIKEGVFFQNY